MNPLTFIRAVAARDLGVLLRVEFLDAAGKIEHPGTDSVVAARDLRLTPRAISFFWAEGDRAHAHRLRRIDRLGDEWRLLIDNPGIRLYIGPLWHAEQRAVLAAWLSRPQMPSLRDELDDLAASVGRRARGTVAAHIRANRRTTARKGTK